MNPTATGAIMRLASRRLASAMLALAPAMLAACAAPPSQPGAYAGAQFGDTVRIALARQVARPDAAGNADPVAGIDGRSARAALERYQHSFAEPAPQPVTFMLGGSSGK
jgi:hypothetical protein